MTILTLRVLLLFLICISFHFITITALKTKTALTTRMKLSALSQYLSSLKPHIDLDIKKIKDKDILYAYYNTTDSNKQKILITPNKKQQMPLIAEGEYLKTRYQSGWDKFTSQTYSNANPIIQCYSIGLIEGLLSHKEIYAYRKNYEYFFDNGDDILSLKSFLKKVNQNIQDKLSLQLPNDIKEIDIKVLSYLACFHAQINGLHQGYSLIAPEDQSLDISDLYFLNTEGYYSYILSYLSLNDVNVSNRNDFKRDENLFKYYNTNKIDEIWKKLIKRSHCSAIIKLLKDNQGNAELYVGHNTWSGYNELLRTLKHVKYAFEGDNQVIGMKPIEMRYSSYPGIMYSGDEFYQKNKMIIMQTSLSVINQFQFKNAIVNPKEYIPEFMRIMIINFISNTGKEWADNYQSQFKNNHLYIAQWMIIDYNNINKDSGLLYIVEEYPRSVKAIDYTKQLKSDSYYGSFNLPFFKEDHSDIAGFKLFSDVDFFGKEYNPRKYLLEQLEGSIKSLEDFKNVLMYNGYKKPSKIVIDDPSFKDPSNGLAARTIKGHDGAIDFKIVDSKMINEGKMYVYSGPVYDTNPNFEVYDLNKEGSYMQKYSQGMPRIWNFKPFTYN